MKQINFQTPPSQAVSVFESYSAAHEEIVAVSRPLPYPIKINEENEIKQTCFVKWKCLICVFLSNTQLPLNQIKATRRLSAINARLVCDLPQVFLFRLTQTIF